MCKLVFGRYVFQFPVPVLPENVKKLNKSLYQYYKAVSASPQD